jgi:hypothetical protein
MISTYFSLEEKQVMIATLMSSDMNALECDATEA